MNNEGVDESKRQFLTSALTVVGAVGTGYLALKPWQRGRRSKLI
jgi:ubiquinol-cytochrome c reductase iron-sulfur subunit